MVLRLGLRPCKGNHPPATGAGDGDLVAAAQINPLAFDQLYERYANPILNYCYYRLGSWEEAEDAAQQIFTNAYAGLRRFRDRDGSFRAWLFTVAHHEVANRQRGHVRHPNVSLEMAAEISDPGPTPEELAIVAERQGRVRALLADLSVDQRQVMELRFAGLTDVEIAAVLNKAPGAVRGVQARAVVRLRQLLNIQDLRQGGSDG